MTKEINAEVLFDVEQEDDGRYRVTINLRPIGKSVKDPAIAVVLRKWVSSAFQDLIDVFSDIVSEHFDDIEEKNK